MVLLAIRGVHLRRSPRVGSIWPISKMGQGGDEQTVFMYEKATATDFGYQN